jgi:hypothetical protein
MRCALIVLLVLASAGCIAEKTQGTTVPIDYEPLDLAMEASAHQNELVRLSGQVSAGYMANNELVCTQYYFYTGTNIRISGDVLPAEYPLDGSQVTVTGILENPICDAPCECTPVVEVQTYSVRPGAADISTR